MHTLMFESDPQARSILSRVFRDGGRKVTVADSLGALEGMIESLEVDVCVVDLDADGAALDLIARTSAADPYFVAMVTTASEGQRIAVRAFEAGSKAFLRKPFSEQELRLKLTKVSGARAEFVRSQHLLGNLILDRSDLRLKVAERERFLSHLIDAAPFAIYSTDHENRIVSFNRAAQELYGYNANEVVGTSAAVLYPDGKVHRSLSEKPLRTEHVAKNGDRRSVIARVRRIVNTLGNHVADLHIVEDVSDREQAEDQLLHAERLSALGRAAPQLAHEFKSPIQVIMGSADLAKSALDGREPDVDEWLGCILESAAEMGVLVSQMMNLGRSAETKRTRIYLGKELRDVLDTLEPVGLFKQVDVQLDVRSPVSSFLGNQAEIGQVVRNLVINAMHALERTESNRLSLRVSSDDQDVVLLVEDEGVGIPRVQLEKVFEPFFTTKSESEGTGLGLSIVKKIVERHQGTIEVTSEVGVGTTFVIRFPIE